MSNFIPTTRKEANQLGIREFDVILVTADAYVDHPAFGVAIIGRYLESLDLKVGIIPQPNWKKTDDFTVLGRPRLFFGVTGGNLDSMVALYTAQRKIRSEDAYSEGGTAGRRPEMPTVIYTQRIKQAFKDVPVVIGGIEASLRRIAHYDFYREVVKPSILLDAKADMLVYGNGEAPLRELVARLSSGEEFQNIRNIRGTAVPVKGREKPLHSDAVAIPSLEEVRSEKSAFADMTHAILDNLNPHTARPLLQEAGTRAIRINPPTMPMTTKELDAVFALPFTRKAHPRYKDEISALRTVRHSIISHRGCYGGCRFCALTLHQGKSIQSRSRESILSEVDQITSQHRNPVIITDIGGPTANMYMTGCRDQGEQNCTRASCLYPNICPRLETDSTAYESLLEDVLSHPRVRGVFINSGIRYDLALKNKSFIRELVRKHTGGHVSVAPEHCSSSVLHLMGKPDIKWFTKFRHIFQEIAGQEAANDIFLMPYMIIGYPGATPETEKELEEFVHKNRIKMEQIQEFTPTPMTPATAMYYTETDIFTGNPIHVEKKSSVKKKWKQRVIGKE